MLYILALKKKSQIEGIMLNTHPQIKFPERIVNNKPVVLINFGFNQWHWEGLKKWLVIKVWKQHGGAPIFQNTTSKILKPIK